MAATKPLPERIQEAENNLIHLAKHNADSEAIKDARHVMDKLTCHFLDRTDHLKAINHD